MKRIITLTLLLSYFIVGCNNSNQEGNNNNNDSIIDLDTHQTSQIPDINDNSKEQDKQATTEQGLLHQDEKLVFSFRTEKGKIMNLAIQKEDKYMVYRFGTDNTVELQFPEKLENTFDQFTYHFYMRGGGPSNEGLDLNYLSFLGETHQFIIYEEHSFGDSDEEQMDVGIRIVDLKTKKETKIKGISSSVKGSLTDFRFNDLVKVEEGEI